MMDTPRDAAAKRPPLGVFARTKSSRGFPSCAKYSLPPLMRRVPFAVAALLALLAVPARASTPVAPLPQLAAAAWYASGEDDAVVASHDAGVRRPMASITKLMTAIVTLEHTRLSDVVTVDARAARTGEATVFLRPGEKLTVAELLRGMLVRSANDAAEALALYVGHGSQARFAALMNAKAEELGLRDTHYANPHGLDAPGHVSSARDTTALVRYALGIPFIRDALGQPRVTIPGEGVFETTDDLLESWPPLVAGKTGHTAGAGWSETGAAREHGITVYGTVLGTAGRVQRNEALQTLLQYALERYRRVVAVDPGRVYARAKVGYGKSPIELVAQHGAVRTIRERTPLVERVVAPTSVTLPVSEGQPLGSIQVYAGNRLVASTNLVARAGASKPGVVGRVVWYTKRTAHHLWELVT
jgi:D-alanyl-D-alanine carboxypeptidase (penicillin-binding protein 5/6)